MGEKDGGLFAHLLQSVAFGGLTLVALVQAFYNLGGDVIFGVGDKKVVAGLYHHIVILLLLVVNLEEIYQRAGEIDNILLLYLKDVAGQAKYPPKAFRSCRGIISLEKKYGLDRLVAACACATEGRLYGYNEVREILERGDDAVFLPPDEEGTKVAREPQRHKNIRGSEYYLQKPQPTNITSDKDNGNNKQQDSTHRA